MLAINHALGGAVIGLTVSNPAIAVPLAFMSHFALDTIPHFDWPGNEAARIGRKAFHYQLVGDAILCFLLVVFLFMSKPKDWFIVAVCAFAATAPDLLWIPKFIKVVHRGQKPTNDNWFYKFHFGIQWKTSPWLWWVEALWFILAGTTVIFLAT
ncbi:MAG: hypothetical protein WBP26_03230 [Candidatus Saccharimonadales bacterium]